MTATLTDGGALLRAVIAEPDDTAVRLVYADALEEAGEGERAEFIRVQCRLDVSRESWSASSGECWQCYCARTGKQHTNGRCHCSAEWKTDRRRERELLESPCDTWFPLPAGLRTAAQVRKAASSVVGCCSRHADNMACDCLRNAVRADFRGGFVEAIHLPCADWLAHGPRLVRLAPLREVRLTDVEPLELQEGPWAGVWFYTKRDIPPELWRRFRDHAGVFTYFDSAEEARAELSEVCLAHALATEPTP